MNNHGPVASMAGWTFSLALHGLSLGTAIVLAAEFSVIPRDNHFRWDVTLISAPAQQPLDSDIPSSTAASSTPLSSSTGDVSSHRATSPGPTLRTVSARMPKKVSLTDQETISPVPAKHTSSEPASIDNAASDPGMTPIEPTLPNQDSDVPSTHTATDWPVTTATSADTPPPSVETTELSNIAMEPSLPEALRPVNRPSPRSREAAISRTIQADYGWLAKMLFTEVEQAKRYPALARRQHWQGSVVLQARIHEDGRISDIVVIEPSGHRTLDLDAIALLEGTSPMSLKYPLGQPSVVVQIPIGYRLE